MIMLMTLSHCVVVKVSESAAVVVLKVCESAAGVVVSAAGTSTGGALTASSAFLAASSAFLSCSFAMMASASANFFFLLLSCLPIFLGDCFAGGDAFRIFNACDRCV